MQAKKKAKRAETRGRILQEIVDSERLYLDNMRLVVEIYIKPLEGLLKKSDCITSAELMAIFSNLQSICELNTDLLQSLESRKEDESLGKIFMDIAPVLKFYSVYVNNYDLSLTTLAACRAREDFETFLKRCQEDERLKAGDISSYLIQPVQRIPRYELLLRDLIKNTEKDHPDLENLEAAIGQIALIAQKVNESKSRQEKMSKVLEVQVRFAAKPVFESFVAPHRHFIRQDKLTKKPSSFKAGGDRRRHFFLFNDIIIYAKRSKVTDKYEFKGRIELGQSTIKAGKDSDECLFEIMSPQGTFRIIAPDTATRDVWITDVGKAIENLQTSLLSTMDRPASQHIS